MLRQPDLSHSTSQERFRAHGQTSNAAPPRETFPFTKVDGFNEQEEVESAADDNDGVAEGRDDQK